MNCTECQASTPDGALINGLCHECTAKELKEQAQSHLHTIHELAEAKAELARVNSTSRRFPIQRGPSVPWEVMAPHESMAQKNHSQSLERLAERGGLSPGEAWCVVNGIDLSRSIETPTNWKTWDQEWFKYAERINLHFDELTRVNAALPSTYYAGLPTAERVANLVAHWRRLVPIAEEFDRAREKGLA